MRVISVYIGRLRPHSGHLISQMLLDNFSSHVFIKTLIACQDKQPTDGLYIICTNHIVRQRLQHTLNK